MLPFGRRERDNYHERGSFKVKLCQHVYASTMAEQMKVATYIEVKFLLHQVTNRNLEAGTVKLTREFSCGVGQVSLKCGILQLLIKRSPLTCNMCMNEICG